QDVAVIEGLENPEVQVGFLDGIFGTIAVKQREFYQALVASLRSFRSNPNAGWLLMGLSFAYGIFHAAGPGHGKAIITSYVVANNETLRKGVVLSFASAFAQALTAIVLVGGLAVVFNLTSIAITDTAHWFEIGSYVLITGLGAWLLWQKAIRPVLVRFSVSSADGALALAGAGHGHSHHDHSHHHGGHSHGHHHHDIGADGVCSSCGHAHAPTPDMIQGKITVTRALSIILAVGLRPCTGALVVLVFALSQGMIAAGIASTLAMAVGTGITVSLLAGLAVGAKDLAVRLFGEGSAMSVRIHRTIEIVGAAVVFLLGLTLLIAAVGWG
ncbi:MAG: nickel/cobalt transporter, partial [Roseibium sp.]